LTGDQLRRRHTNAQSASSSPPRPLPLLLQPPPPATELVVPVLPPLAPALLPPIVPLPEPVDAVVVPPPIEPVDPLDPLDPDPPDPEVLVPLELELVALVRAGAPPTSVTVGKYEDESKPLASEKLALPNEAPNEVPSEGQHRYPAAARAQRSALPSPVTSASSRVQK
jgi:hypothetical protein